MTFKITAEEKLFILRKRASLAAVSPEQKAIVDRLRKLMKKLGIKARYKSQGGKSTWVEVWTRDKDFPIDLRNAALDSAFGKDFKRDRERPRAGNIMARSIALLAEQWEPVLKKFGV